ncbi:hypothetical protein T06_8329 [Trichinella sp. T6]|nr:hypothetical protein T06_8329 [Trichinella sp. T6]
MFDKGICVKSCIIQYSDITPGNLDKSNLDKF